MTERGALPRTMAEHEAAWDLVWFRLAARRFNTIACIKAQEKIDRKSLTDPDYKAAIETYLKDNPLLMPHL